MRVSIVTLAIPQESSCVPCAPHYCDVMMGEIPYQITSLTIVYSTVYSDAYLRKHQSSASLAFVWGIHRGPVNSPHKWRVKRKMFPFDDVIMQAKHFIIPLLNSAVPSSTHWQCYYIQFNKLSVNTSVTVSQKSIYKSYIFDNYQRTLRYAAIDTVVHGVELFSINNLMEL